MKRVLLMLAATAAFACMTAYAQAGGGAGAGGGQAGGGNTSGGSASTGGTGSMAGQNANGQSQMGAEMNGKKANKGAKDTITGCLSATAGSDGMFTLTSDKDNSQIEVGPSDKLQASAGKKVKLSGSWSSAAAAGENASSANAGVASSTSSEQSERHFDVKKVKQESGSCSAQGSSTGTSNPPPQL